MVVFDLDWFSMVLDRNSSNNGSTPDPTPGLFRFDVTPLGGGTPSGRGPTGGVVGTWEG